MLSETDKTSFLHLAQQSGKIIETTIFRFYEEASNEWPQGSLLIDGGANRGWHSKRMAKLLPVERVVAIEANPATYEEFKTKIERTKKLSKIDLRHAALQSNSQLANINFHVSPNHPGRSGINPAMRGIDGTEFGESISVPATTIDKLVSEQERSSVKFIKLDLEGGEYDAFCGGRETLRVSRPVCVFENGPMTAAMNGFSPHDMLSIFQEAGLILSNFFGNPVTNETLADFWYVWAFPQDSFDKHANLLKELVREETRKFNE